MSSSLLRSWFPNHRRLHGFALYVGSADHRGERGGGALHVDREASPADEPEDDAAVCARESVGEDTALQIRTRFVLDVLGKAALVMLVRVGKKAREVLAHDPVERRLLGTTRGVGGCEAGQRAASRARLVPRSPRLFQRLCRGTRVTRTVPRRPGGQAPSSAAPAQGA
jgi:hypothetical protein